MSKCWYPIIDYNRCCECGKCVNKCQQGVYDKSKMPKPIVVYPDGCIQGCHGCGNLCPNRAITYEGDNSNRIKRRGLF